MLALLLRVPQAPLRMTPQAAGAADTMVDMVARVRRVTLSRQPQLLRWWRPRCPERAPPTAKPMWGVVTLGAVLVE